MSRTLLVLGAGPLQIPALRWAREAGLTSVVTSADARAKRLAGEFHSLSPCDVDAHLALTRVLARDGALAGVLVSDERGLRLLATLAGALALPVPPRAALALALEPARAREHWRAHGLVTNGSDEPRERFDVGGFFRDGAFVPAGCVERRALPLASRVSEWGLCPPRLAGEELAQAFVLAERAARTLGITHGPVQVTLAAGERGLALIELFPGFRDAVAAAHVTPLAYGKSPLQAWFGALAEAGGPFDELPLAPTATAGWMAVLPERTGFFAGVDGAARARALPGVVDLWLEEPGREIDSLSEPAAVCGFVWARGDDRNELERRLRAARAALEVRVACRQVA